MGSNPYLKLQTGEDELKSFSVEELEWALHETAQSEKQALQSAFDESLFERCRAAIGQSQPDWLLAARTPQIGRSSEIGKKTNGQKVYGKRQFSFVGWSVALVLLGFIIGAAGVWFWPQPKVQTPVAEEKLPLSDWLFSEVLYPESSAASEVVPSPTLVSLKSVEINDTEANDLSADFRSRTTDKSIRVVSRVLFPLSGTFDESLEASWRRTMANSVSGDDSVTETDSAPEIDSEAVLISMEELTNQATDFDVWETQTGKCISRLINHFSSP